jgi:hypothetical protein
MPHTSKYIKTKKTKASVKKHKTAIKKRKKK